MVALLPEPTAAGIDETLAAIAKAVGTARTRSPKPSSLDAADWLGKLGAAAHIAHIAHIAHGAGHYMTTGAGPILDTIHVASLRTVAR